MTYREKVEKYIVSFLKHEITYWKLIDYIETLIQLGADNEQTDDNNTP